MWYDRGKGTAVDKKKALYWYGKAAEQGDVTAQFNIGLMYYLGEGTDWDMDKSRAFFQKVAAQTEDKELQEKAKEFLREFL